MTWKELAQAIDGLPEHMLGMPVEIALDEHSGINWGDTTPIAGLGSQHGTMEEGDQPFLYLNDGPQVHFA